MHNLVFPVVLVGLLSLGVFGGCSSSQESPEAAADTTLSEAEWGKIDADLTRLMSDSVKITDIPLRNRDGTRVFAVWIRTSDPDALKAAGVTADSTEEGRVRAWLSLAKIREVARLQFVEAIRADNDPLPRKGMEEEPVEPPENR